MMENNKELIHRALLGDQKAQKQCTEKRIVLPCPFCGSENIVISNWGLCRVWCQVCLGKSDDQLSQADAIRKWNTRPAPPIGKCGECKHQFTGDSDICHSGMDNEFCSGFEPREE